MWLDRETLDFIFCHGVDPGETPNDCFHKCELLGEGEVAQVAELLRTI